MSGDRKPRVGDRVRVTYEGVYTTYGTVLNPTRQSLSFEIPTGTTVEVLEPADDPSRRPVGTVMRGTEDTTRGNVVVRIEVAPHAEFQWNSVTCGQWYEHADLIGFEVIGVVPGTPAAEQERERHMHNAGYCGACNMVHDRREYVPPVPEVIEYTGVQP